jgi:predicted dehydrogenase
MPQPINVAIVGTKFMGRAHSNAFTDVSRFFTLPLTPVLKAACGRNEAGLAAFAARFGWQSTETSWEKLVARDDIQVVDICTSNATHMPIAVAAAGAGKHVICEKPMARTAAEARQMLDAARNAGVCHMVAFNYRRVPAIALARQLLDQGKIGKIVHCNAVYYQDWLADPAATYSWRNDAGEAGSGAHGDLQAHIVDLARYLCGEFAAVTGEMRVVVKERPLAGGRGMGAVTADDTSSFLARFQNGAQGAFLATRLATGRKNFLRLEVFGDKGGFSFNLERLNELEYFGPADVPAEQGFRTIIVTDGSHPYINHWWPAGHIIGWEHTIIHEVADFLIAVGERTPVHPDFYDGLRCQQVLDAVAESSASGRWVDIPAGE